MARDGSYQIEVDRLALEDDDLYRRDHLGRQEVEDHAAGVRSDLEDYCPVSGLWYGADVLARASRRRAA